jgi:hypothetical protein
MSIQICHTRSFLDPDWIRIQQQTRSGSGFSKIPGSGSGITMAKILITTGKHRLLQTTRGFPTRIREGGNEIVPGVGLPQLVPRLHKGGVQLHSPAKQFLTFLNSN